MTKYSVEENTGRIIFTEDMGRILVVEDDNDSLYAITLLISKNHISYTIGQAKNATEASKLINEQKTPYDVAVVDMWLPEGEEAGLDVVRSLRSKDEITEIIVLTAHGDLNNVFKALESGANQYIDKKTPQAHRILLKVIENRIYQVRIRRLVEEFVTAVVMDRGGFPRQPGIIKSVARRLSRWFRT